MKQSSTLRKTTLSSSRYIDAQKVYEQQRHRLKKQTQVASCCLDPSILSRSCILQHFSRLCLKDLHNIWLQCSQQQQQIGGKEFPPIRQPKQKPSFANIIIIMRRTLYCTYVRTLSVGFDCVVQISRHQFPYPSQLLLKFICNCAFIHNVNKAKLKTNKMVALLCPGISITYNAHAHATWRLLLTVYNKCCKKNIKFWLSFTLLLKKIIQQYLQIYFLHVLCQIKFKNYLITQNRTPIC